MDKNKSGKSVDKKSTKIAEKSKSPRHKKEKEIKEKKGKEKDENKPKRAMSAYFFFMGENREKITKEGFKGKDVMTEAGRIWGNMKDTDKAKYEEMAKRDKDRYVREMKEYEEKGHFVSEDGNKKGGAKDVREKSKGKDVGKKEDKKEQKAPPKKGKKEESSDEEDD